MSSLYQLFKIPSSIVTGLIEKGGGGQANIDNHESSVSSLIDRQYYTGTYKETVVNYPLLLNAAEVGIDCRLLHIRYIKGNN